MDLLVPLLIAVACMAAAIYAHLRIPHHAPGQGWGARLILVVTGVAFGYVMAAHYLPAEGLRFWLVFLSGFGVVHVPAAAILFIKRQRARV
ncbi:hypothetical protein HUS23_00170 [Ectothiorhodospiraceae bacterium 2226]|nr:hypothetical protein HUS23_00170 [Ectothiorhodospiraceae bacterium 2226]